MRPIYKSAIIFAILVISLNLALLAFAYLSTGKEYVFGGILFNPLDGNTYLAKIQEGFNGSWRFTLPYECKSGQGAYVLLYYLFLGHLTRWLGVSGIFIFHFTRIVNSIILIFTLAAFIQKIIPDQVWAVRALWLAGLGSGMGWILLPFGVITADMWLAEAYPFLSMQANPHFPLGLAIFLAILLITLKKETWRNALLAGVLSLLLAVIQPFMIVTVLLVVFLFALYRFILVKEFRIRNLLLIMGCGFPYLIYQYWVLNTDPILAQWMAQNQTPAPALWDLVLSLSPVILFAIVGLIRIKKIESENRLFIAFWLLATLIMAYVPIALQRRFLAGVYIAGALLAVLGILTFANQSRVALRLYRIVLLLSLPGTALILLISMFGVITHSPVLYLSHSEAQALSWLKSNTPQGSLVITSPEIGVFVPARSGNCVIYGHPYETINAEQEKTSLIAYLSGEDVPSITDQIHSHLDPVYLFYGPREAVFGNEILLNNMVDVYSDDGVTIYQFDQK